MKNIRNYGMVTGRLTRDSDIRVHADGSRKVRFTVAVQDAFTDREGKRDSQFLPLEAFLSADREGSGAYGCISRGDLVACSYTVNNNNYTNRNGQQVYGLTLLVNEIALLESKASKAARQAAKPAP